MMLPTVQHRTLETDWCVGWERETTRPRCEQNGMNICLHVPTPTFAQTFQPHSNLIVCTSLPLTRYDGLFSLVCANQVCTDKLEHVIRALTNVIFFFPISIFLVCYDVNLNYTRETLTLAMLIFRMTILIYLAS